MKRRRGFTWVELLVMLVIIGILAAIFYPAFNGERHGPIPRRACAVNLKQLGMAMMQYAQENDERFPPVAFNNVPQSLPPYKKPFGWADAIFVFAQNSEIYQCPKANQTASSEDATQNGFTDYWMNRNASNAKLEKFTSPSKTILLGDGNDGTDNTNARYALNALPRSWRDTENSPARRHLDTANYAFADGHVKSFAPEKISNLPTKQSGSTFSVR